ncbi:unnamed protein product [Phytophthora fragariaefolia]|uniref:Unnamed protein product n=1 Tax=Phytophthora fragariaefolia TaxID=1490495 RepID=A0A9W6Y982_9STRA|nr:unnamed protein product [Phytophthora fragariaefolia]
MYVAHEGHGFEMLPAMTVHERWNTLAALEAKVELVAAADSLLPIVQMSTLKSPKLEAWKKTVDSGLGRTNKRTAQRSTHIDSGVDVIDDNGNENGSEASEMVTFDPAEAVDTATLMDALEATPIDELSNEDEDELPPTQLTRVKPNIPQSKSLCTTEQNYEVIAANVKHGIVKHFPALMQPTRQVDIINVPKPKRRGRSRASPKQMRQKTLSAKPDRVAVHKYPSDLSVSLDQLLTWARNTPNLKDVKSIMETYLVQLDDAHRMARTIECQWQLVRASDYMYTFVIPSDLARSMQASVITARKERHKPDETTDLVKTQGVGLSVIASIDPNLWKFSRSLYEICFSVIGALTGFYAINSKNHSWMQEWKWLDQDWCTVDANVDLLAVETKTSGIPAYVISERHQEMAIELIATFASGGYALNS